MTIKTLLSVPKYFILFAFLVFGTRSLNAQDLVEQEVESAIVNGFYKNKAGLQKNVEFFQRLDQRLQQQNKITGLLDNIQDLQINQIQDYSTSIEAKKELLAEEHLDEILTKRLEYHLELDPLLYIQTLENEGVYNRVSAIFNDLARYSFLIAAGNLLAIGNSAIDVLFTLWSFPKMTIHQKKILVLLEEHLKKKDPERRHTELWQELEDLQEKRKALYFDRELAELEELIHEENWEVAESLIAYLKKNYPGQKILQEVDPLEQNLLQQERLRKRALFVESGKDQGTPAQEKMIEDIFVAFSRQEWNQASQLWLQGSPLFHQTPLEDEWWYLRSILIEKQQGRTEAIAFLEENPYPEQNMGKYVTQQLLQVDYHRKYAIAQAKSNYRWDTTKYIFTGTLSSTGTLKAVSKRILSQGVEAGTSLGIFYGLGVLLRSIRVLFSNPVSTEGIIDAYLRALEEQEKEEMRLALVDLYEDLEEYEKALFHLKKTPHAKASDIEDLQESIQEKWFELAEQINEPEVQEKILKRLLEQYPSSSLEPQVQEKLQQVLVEKEKEYHFSWDTCARFPELLEWLDLSPELVDGRLANGELGEKGAYLLKSGELMVYLENEQKRRIPLSSPALYELRSKLEQWKFQETLKEQIYHISPYGYFPLEIYGSVGAQGVLVYPRFKQKYYANPDRKLFE